MQEELSYYKVTLFKSEICILSFLWSSPRPCALFQIHHQCHKTTAGDHQRQLLDLGLPSLQDCEAGKLSFMKHSVESVPPTAKENRLKQHPNKLPHGLKENQQQSSEHGSGHKIERPRGTLCFCYALDKMTLQTKVGRMLYLLTSREAPIRDQAMRALLEQRSTRKNSCWAQEAICRLGSSSGLSSVACATLGRTEMLRGLERV